jgi:hypothetical protein
MGPLISFNQFNEMFVLQFRTRNVNISIALLPIYLFILLLTDSLSVYYTVVCGRVLCEFEIMRNTKLTSIAYALMLRLKSTSKSKTTPQLVYISAL